MMLKMFLIGERSFTKKPCFCVICMQSIHCLTAIYKASPEKDIA